MANLTGLGIRYRNIDVVIAVVERMVIHGQIFKDATHYVAVEFGRSLQNVEDNHCLKVLRLWKDQFIEFVESGEIIDHLKRCHPKDVDEIEERLRPLYT
ncbi:MAG: hypothetical protein OXN20_13530 [Gemmatimonadota bacterium]|nr:hypothetical protein [Gemmatimonadota bacterium]